MTFTSKDLPNGGHTQFFTFQYNDTLSQARGLDLAKTMMADCDSDLQQIVNWFSGRSLDTVLPINIFIDTVATDPNTGAATGFVGASWSGYGLVPLNVTISLGELAMTSGTAPMFARGLMVAEVTEMYMRGMATLGFSPWFGNLDEGNKGEALSRFLSTQFLLKNFPGIAALPSVFSTSPLTTNVWLNSPRANFLDAADDDTAPDPEIACCTLFLFYLHDQLGFRIEDIINAGAHTLSQVYANLTGDSASNAFTKFSSLVNSHYPHAADQFGFFSPSYNPPLDTVFPVRNLAALVATPIVTWVSSTQPVLNVLLDGPTPVPVAIALSSDHPNIIPAPSLGVSATQASSTTPFTVKPQPAGFLNQPVTLTATYAGVQRTALVMVFAPTAAALPALQIDVDRSADLCQPLFVDGSSQTFGVTNLSVFGAQAGLVFAWSVTGATPDATNGQTVTLSKLPAAGNTVEIDVTVTSPQGLQAKGSLSFKTVALDFKVLQGELVCRMSKLRTINLSIAPWIPIEKGGLVREQLGLLDRQLTSVSRATRSMTQVMEQMREQAAKAGTNLR